MKYIRTKDGKISYLDTEPYEDEPNYVVITSKGKINFYSHDQVIKQADTIEELCDEFVIIYNKSKRFKKPFASAHDNLKDLLEEHELSKCKVYGAIWTDKGLIYVAKMNYKGELELL